MRVKIKELGDIITGNTPSKKNLEFWDSNDICFVKPDIIADGCITAIEKSNEYISETARSKARVVKKDTIFVTCIGSIGKIGIAEEGEYAFNQQINAVVPNSKINARYLAYAILYSKPQLAAIANSAVVPIINKSQFGDFEINITEDIKKQEEIVNILDRTNGIIESRQQELQKLDELIKARFVEMFADKYATVKLGDVIRTTSGGTPSKAHPEYYDSGTIPWLTSGEVNAGIITSVKNYITEEGMKKSSAKMVPANSVVIAMYGATAGVTGIIRLDTTTNQAVCSLLPNERYLPEYLYYAVASKKDWMISQCKGGGQPNISQGIIKDMDLLDAPLEVQKRFAEFANRVDKSKVMKPRDLLVS